MMGSKELEEIVNQFGKLVDIDVNTRFGYDLRWARVLVDVVAWEVILAYLWFEVIRRSDFVSNMKVGIEIENDMMPPPLNCKGKDIVKTTRSIDELLKVQDKSLDLVDGPLLQQLYVASIDTPSVNKAISVAPTLIISIPPQSIVKPPLKPTTLVKPLPRYIALIKPAPKPLRPKFIPAQSFAPPLTKATPSKFVKDFVIKRKREKECKI